MITEDNQPISSTIPLPAKIGGLIVWLLVSFSAGWFGATFEPGAWYLTINKPAWTPPGWVFPPVWTLLYIAMGVAVWLVWLKGGWRMNRIALMAFLVQLALNAAWSWIFFGEHHIGLALLDIVCLFIMILTVTGLFWKRRRIAGFLMLPYAVWVGFASALNFQIWRIN